MYFRNCVEAKIQCIGALRRFLMIDPKKESTILGDSNFAEVGKKALENNDKLAAFGAFEESVSLSLWNCDEQRVKEYLELAAQVASSRDQLDAITTMLNDLSRTMEIAKGYYVRMGHEPPPKQAN